MSYSNELIKYKYNTSIFNFLQLFHHKKNKKYTSIISIHHIHPSYPSIKSFNFQFLQVVCNILYFEF